MSKDTDQTDASKLDRRTYLKTAGTLGLGVGATTYSNVASAQTTLPPVDITRITIDHNWTTVTLDNSYSDPVVFGLPPSYHGWNPCSTRLRNITSTAFEITLEEWLYLDRWHTTEAVGCFITESGIFTLDNSTTLEIGRLQTDHRWNATKFSASFSSTPVILSQTQTLNGGHPVVTRHRNASSSEVDVRLQEEEAHGHHVVEEIGYLAIDPGTGDLDGRTFEADIVDSIDDSWTTLSFTNSYEQPVFLADLQTFRGYNTATLRYRNLTGSSVEVMVEEEQSADSEQNHVEERVGYLVLEGANVGTDGYGLGGYGSGGYGA